MQSSFQIEEFFWQEKVEEIRQIEWNFALFKLKCKQTFTNILAKPNFCLPNPDPKIESLTWKNTQKSSLFPKKYQKHINIFSLSQVPTQFPSLWLNGDRPPKLPQIPFQPFVFPRKSSVSFIVSWLPSN